MKFQEFHAGIKDSGLRIDVFVSGKTGITRSRIQKFLENGSVLVNATQAKQNYRVKAGDVIQVKIPEETHAGLIPEELPLEILYEDAHLIVVNKPAGMVVYPAPGNQKGTLMNALFYHCGKLASAGGPLRPGVVHRLDKDTSGVMVIALTDNAYYSLIEQFRQRTIKRRYIALVYGNMRHDKGEISLEIGRSVSDRKKMSTRTRKGKEAATMWKVIERFGSATLIEARLRTGRTHQIRVHFASVGHPVLGDKTYGGKIELEIKNKEKILFRRQMLHAEVQGFIHPDTNEYLEFSSPVPEDMEKSIIRLRS